MLSSPSTLLFVLANLFRVKKNIFDEKLFWNGKLAMIFEGSAVVEKRMEFCIVIALMLHTINTVFSKMRMDFFNNETLNRKKSTLLKQQQKSESRGSGKSKSLLKAHPLFCFTTRNANICLRKPFLNLLFLTIYLEAWCLFIWYYFLLFIIFPLWKFCLLLEKIEKGWVCLRRVTSVLLKGLYVPPDRQ